jgi:hypothetical protein
LFFFINRPSAVDFDALNRKAAEEKREKEQIELRRKKEVNLKKFYLLNF